MSVHALGIVARLLRKSMFSATGAVDKLEHAHGYH